MAEKKANHQVGALSTTTIDILRHGECQGGQIYRGSTDVELNELGWQQMQASVEFALQRGAEWDYVVSSPLKRCALFAASLTKRYGLEVRLEPGFRETDFGEWEGLAMKEVWKTQRESVEAWFADPGGQSPPGGERTEDFRQRVDQSLQVLVNDCRADTQAKSDRQANILVIAHGGVIRMLLSHCLSMPLSAVHQMDVPYACLSQMQFIHSSDVDFSRLIHHNIHQSAVSGSGPGNEPGNERGRGNKND